jgi:hypothetical protein
MLRSFGGLKTRAMTGVSILAITAATLVPVSGVAHAAINTGGSPTTPPPTGPGPVNAPPNP